MRSPQSNSRRPVGPDDDPDELASPAPALIRTADGSNTLLHPGNGQSYHSMNGALQEANHVFLQQGLVHFLQQNGAQSARILEVGFGAGLNFIVSAVHCLGNGLTLRYTGIEPFPVSREMLAEIGYVDLLPGADNQKAYLEGYSGYPGEETIVLRENPVESPNLSGNPPNPSGPEVMLQLLRKPVLETGSLSPCDIVYFDAFAPAVQGEMWTREVISHVTSALETGGIFVSYSITGHLKRLLKELGFAVEKAPGAAGKREMIRATRL